MATAQPLTDHEQIRRWAEERGAQPACVRDTGGEGDLGMIRLDFPGFSGEESLQPVSWEEWFRAFDANGLALLVQQDASSRFNKLVSRASARSASSEPARSRGGSRSGGRTTPATGRTQRGRKQAAAKSARRASTRSTGSKSRSRDAGRGKRKAAGGRASKAAGRTARAGSRPAAMKRTTKRAAKASSRKRRPVVKRPRRR